MPRSVLFFGFFYVYLAFAVDVRLLYHCCGLIDNFPSFYRGWDFFRDFLTYPGGMVAYLAALLAQSFYYAWLGAAVVTAQAWLICWCTGRVIEAFGGHRWRALRFLGPLLLLAAYAQYGFHFPTTVGFTVALAAFCLYLKVAPARGRGTVILFPAISIVLYAAVGGPYLLFAALGVLYELSPRRQPALSLIQLAIGATIPYILGVLIWQVRRHDAYLELLPLSWKITSRNASEIMRYGIYALYIFLPVAAGLKGTWTLFLDKRRSAGSRRRAGRRARSASRIATLKAAFTRLTAEQDNGGAGLNLPTLMLAVVTALTLFVYRAPGIRKIFRVDYYSRQKMWDEVLEIGRNSPYHYLICHAVNRALFHTDQLGDQMFHYPQHPTALFLTRKGPKALWQKVDTCMDIGLLNQAENSASICVESFGERPLLLQRLATINVAKKNVNIACVFLRALEKVPFWGPVARRRLMQLEADPNCSEDPEIQHLRSIMLKTDFVRDADTLTLLLTENPCNRMAYEYGMASLLLSKNLDDFVKIFNRYHRLNATRIPRHYAEALLLSRAVKKQPLDVPGQNIDREIKLQLHEFLQALQQGSQASNATKDTLRATLKGPYGNTYFYYFFLGE